MARQFPQNVDCPCRLGQETGRDNWNLCNKYALNAAEKAAQGLVILAFVSDQIAHVV
jgi:hypothetical protein